MADQRNDLRVRVTDDLDPRRRRIEVLDADDNVLGDLAASVGGVTYKMGITDVSIVLIELAVERVKIESIEVPGVNTRRQT